MTDLQDIRSRLRDDVRRGSSSDEGASKNYTLVFATCGLVIGFALFMFVPRFFQSHDTAIMHDISAARPAAETGARPPEGRYTGKSPDEIATLADEVCAQRGPAQRVGKPPRLADMAGDFLNADGMKRINEQIHCLLTEGPMRFCSATQQRMIVGELTLYFHGIEQANRQYGTLRGASARTGVEEIIPESRVIMALEARLRDGELTSANRDMISGEAPRWVRDRLVKIEPRQSICPQKPWWAIWK
jgi:hypothetical protein